MKDLNPNKHQNKTLTIYVKSGVEVEELFTSFTLILLTYRRTEEQSEKEQGEKSMAKVSHASQRPTLPQDLPSTEKVPCMCMCHAQADHLGCTLQRPGLYPDPRKMLLLSC